MRKRLGTLLICVVASLVSAQTIKHAVVAPKVGGWPKPAFDARMWEANGIQYNGGAVNTAGPTVYYIWYGDWQGNTAVPILTDMAAAIGGTPYFNTDTTYFFTTDGVHFSHIANHVAFGGATGDSYSQGKRLNDNKVKRVVENAISTGELPKDDHGVYFVLTSPDVTETSGFCRNYCGWHSNAAMQGTDIKYAFIGNPARCPEACEPQTSSSPNENPAADAMASVIAHELQEATTDPDLDAWFDHHGDELGDKCAWTYGSAATAPNGSRFNVTWGARRFLIQQAWVNANGGYCALSWP